jgi:hypothetical protein
MNPTSISARRPHPAQGSSDRSFHIPATDPGKSTRPHLASLLVAAILLAVPILIVGSSAATAARRTGRHPASCGDATGARWHIKHYFYK